MKVEHLPADASPQDITKVLQRDGCAVVDRLVSRAAIEVLLGGEGGEGLGNLKDTVHRLR